jgi:rare lipoprotein A
MRLRRSAFQSGIAIALAGLMSSGPVQAVPLDGGSRMESLADTVASLDESAPEAIVQSEPAQAEPVQNFEAIGGGEASYYGNELAGNRTASGERFNPRAFTAAHRSLPMGTRLRVTNQSNGKSVIVRVNDRGPFVRSRIIDVSYAAAQQIQMVRAGRAQVKLEIVSLT